MARLKGFVRIEVDVDGLQDDMTDVEYEQEFNHAVQEAWDRGDLADHDWSTDLSDCNSCGRPILIPSGEPMAHEDPDDDEACEEGASLSVAV